MQIFKNMFYSKKTKQLKATRGLKWLKMENDMSCHSISCQLLISYNDIKAAVLAKQILKNPTSVLIFKDIECQLLKTLSVSHLNQVLK